MRRGCPSLALGGGAKVDHLFEGKKSICGKYMWGGGYEVDPEDVQYEQGEVCKACCRGADGVEVPA